MALIKDGYFQDTYWASRYWQEDYWSEYGYVAPPTVTVRAPGMKRRRRHKFFVLDNEVMLLFAEYLQVKVNRDEIQD